MIRILALWLALMVPVVSAEPIVIGSKNFTESYLLSEIVAQLLEANGYEVQRKFGLGGTLVCFEALLNNEIDLYVEYTGTIEQVILKGSDLHPTIDSLNQRIDSSVQVLDSLGFNNTYAIALKHDLAAELGATKISDLASHDLKLAFSLEFMNREDGWPGLAKRYGLDETPTGIEHGLAYQAIDEGKIDVTDAYSTDGDLARYDLAVLADDLAYFPDYFAAPLISRTLDPKAAEIIQNLAGRISDDRMRDLNGQVVIDGMTFAEVAAGFLLAESLITNVTQIEQPSLMDDIIRNTLIHLQLASIALALGCLIGLPIGFVVFRHRRIAQFVVYLAGLLQTIPSIALLALMIPLFGIGMVPAIVALFLYSLLPILRNTVTALVTIDPVLKRVAEALGLTRAQQLRHVLFPMALPTVLAGIRTAAVISIGTATLAAFIGAGGLGEPIVTGLALNDTGLILQGAIPAALLAVVVELAFELLERVIIKPHMREGQLPS